MGWVDDGPRTRRHPAGEPAPLPPSRRVSPRLPPICVRLGPVPGATRLPVRLGQKNKHCQARI